MNINRDNFERINFYVFCCDINGGFFGGGTSIIINLQNSNKLFIDCGSDRREWPISSFDEGLLLANQFLNQPPSL